MTVRRGYDESAFSPPRGVDVGPPPEELTAYDDFTPYSERPGAAREIEPGVYLVPNLRPGFHMFFVAFEDFVLAVDAPSGWVRPLARPLWARCRADLQRPRSGENSGLAARPAARAAGER